MPFVGQDVIYIAVSKTGSVFVTHVLVALCKQTMKSAGDGGRHNPFGAKAYGLPVITTIRHPRTWLPSAFLWMQSANRNHLPGAEGIESRGTFKEFVEQFKPGEVGRIFHKFTRRADYVLRQENLRVELADALETIGLPCNREAIMAYPEKNVTQSVVPADIWDGVELRGEDDFIAKWWRE